MTEDLGAVAVLAAISGQHDIERTPESPVPLTALQSFARETALEYERAPRLHWSPDVAVAYRTWARENLRQLRAVRAAGIRVRPWHGPGQPYRGSAELISSVRRSGTLHVYLTRDGHGSGGDGVFHPQRADSGIVSDGVELAHNDVFRAVHDLFGHVLTGAGFDLRGELTASRAHARLYGPVAQRVLLTEQVGQICWFFHGPHLDGRPSSSPAPRPYPPQKVFLHSARRLHAFTTLFEEGGP